MTNDLFTAPERREAPADLEARILEEIAADEAGDQAVRNRRRWAAGLVAAALVIGLAAAGTTMIRRHQQQTPAHTPATAQSLTGDALLKACAAESNREGSVGHDLTQRSLTREGTAVIMHGDQGLADLVSVCIAFSDGRTLIGLGSSTYPVTVTGKGSDGSTMVAVAAAMPAGTDSVTVGTVSGITAPTPGYWGWSAAYTAGELASEPVSKLIRYHSSGAARIAVVPWPGTVSNSLDRLTGASPCASLTTGKPKLVLPSATGYATLEVRDDGTSAVCWANAGAGTSINAAPGEDVMVAAAVDTLAPSQLAVVAGKMPGGATEGYIVTPQGRVELTVKDGWFIADSVYASSMVGLQPAKIAIVFNGRAPQRRVVSWVADGLTVDAVTTFDTGSRLDAACQGVTDDAGPVLATSLGGHTNLYRKNGSLVVCGSGNGWSVTSDPGTQGYGINGSGEVPGPWIRSAGGALEDGVTAIVYRMPEGDIPAQITGRYWAWEQVVANPKSVAPNQMVTVDIYRGHAVTHAQVKLGH